MQGRFSKELDPSLTISSNSNCRNQPNLGRHDIKSCGHYSQNCLVIETEINTANYSVVLGCKHHGREGM
ncbi:MAG: hypothetical protein ACI97A_003845 [Planctomycetota bacterium]|jgi:hypothetical protein